MSLTTVSEARKKKIMAEFAYAQKDFARARDLTVEAIKNQGDSLVLFTFLGKCLMQLRDFQAALKCFEKAQSLSPMNIERLCAMVEASSELGDKEAAERNLERAKSLDKNATSVIEAEAQMRIGFGETTKAKAIMGKLPTLTNVISFMNNRAVAFARSMAFDEGIALYQKTLDSIPEERRSTQAIVTYNLALTYARMDRLPEALAQLEKTVQLGKSKVYTKSRSLMERIKKAMTGGAPLQLAQDVKGSDGEEGAELAAAAEGAPTEEQKHAAIVATIEASPGEICCLRVFKNPDAPSERVLKLVASVPHFVRRQAIARESGGGVERTMHSQKAG